MTEDQRYEIAVLAEAYQDAKNLFDYLAARNTYGLSAEDSAKLSTNFHMADAEKMQAWTRLEAAKARIAVS